MTRPGRGSSFEVLVTATRLGLTSFGGPVAHLGYFRAEYVERRRWLDDRSYADLVALAQFLPGPASSQVGIAIGTLRAGLRGGVLAWLGFTLPSAIALIVFALAVGSADVAGAGWLHGLELVAVAVVLQALVAMARALAPDVRRAAIALVAAAAILAWQSAMAQLVVLVAGAFAGAVLLGRIVRWSPAIAAPVAVDLRVGLACLVVFVVLLLGLPIAAAGGDPVLRVLDTFYASGALVFGGGHVVLPLLAERVVEPGLVDADRFLAGYGAAQAVPGPLFTFAAYLGAVLRESPNGVAGGLLALAAIFLPSFLLVFGVLPFWSQLRAFRGAAAALAGTNAAVVGLLGASLVHPIGSAAVRGPLDLVVVGLAFVLLVVARVPAWAVVLGGAAGGLALAAVGLR